MAFATASSKSTVAADPSNTNAPVRQTALQNPMKALAEPMYPIAQSIASLHELNASAEAGPTSKNYLLLVGKNSSYSAVVMRHNLETNTGTTVVNLPPMQAQKTFKFQGKDLVWLKRLFNYSLSYSCNV